MSAAAPTAAAERYARQSERQALDLTGQRFGRLVAVRRLGKRGSQGYEWECRCDCGEPKIVLAGVLRSGETRSCGCLRREVHAAPRPYRRKRPYEYLLNQLAAAALARGIECALSYEEFLEFVAQAECFYCGESVEWSPVSKRSGARTNLDRKDNTRGYELGNVVVCCWTCNNARGDRYTFEEWRAMAAALRKIRA